MSELSVLYSDASWSPIGKIVGLTDDCVVASYPVGSAGKVLFVPKVGGASVMLDPFPGTNQTPVGAFGDHVVVQHAAPRKQQTTFLLSKDGEVVNLSKGAPMPKPNVFGARIDNGGVYGIVMNSTQRVNAIWDFEGKITLSSADMYVAGTFNGNPVFGSVDVQLAAALGDSQALFVSNAWVLGRAFDVVDGKTKKSGAFSVSWIWNGSGPAKVLTHPEGKRFSCVSLSPDGRFAAGLSWDPNVVGQEGVVLDLKKNTALNLEQLAGCSEDGGVDFSSCRFDTDGSLFVKRTAVLNGPFEIVKISNLDK
jgi:hypothetical protein